MRDRGDIYSTERGTSVGPLAMSPQVYLRNRRQGTTVGPQFVNLGDSERYVGQSGSDGCETDMEFAGAPAKSIG